MNKQQEKNSHADIAIKVEGVYKDFDLPHEKQNSLKYKLVHPIKSKSTIEQQHALKDISFEVKKGEFFGIVGRNGSGKSTLLKILAEIYTPTKGKVAVNGSLTPFIELGVGFNPELTGRENVYLNGAMLGFSTKEMEKMYDEIVKFAELEKFMDQKLKNYSSGMQVRLAFSVAIQAKSDILLLDEVLAVGDADFQRKCFDYFRELRKENQTVVFVTHDMSAVREYCDRAILIDNSIIEDEGSPRLIASKYSKLFEKELGADSKEYEEKRWGDGTVRIEKVSLEPKSIGDSTKDITLKIKVQANQDSIVKDYVIGFNIHRNDGTIIQGSNSKMHDIKLPALEKGQTTEVCWTIPNVFEEAKYKVDIAITSTDFSHNYDWWEDAVGFKTHNDIKTSYILSHRNLKLSINKATK